VIGTGCIFVCLNKALADYSFAKFTNPEYSFLIISLFFSISLLRYSSNSLVSLALDQITSFTVSSDIFAGSFN